MPPICANGIPRSRDSVELGFRQSGFLSPLTLESGESESSDEGFDRGEEDAARETGTTETEESDGPETPVPPDVPGSEGILFE